ncbi:MAG: 50S ribosomal protein L23 [bacterium]|nr:50S ribosomal protein L23 [bacterium]
MGFLDKFTKKKKTDKKDDEPKKTVKKPAQVDVPKEEETESVLSPDGKLVNVAKKDTKKTKKVKVKKENTGNAYKVIMKPLITEKGSYLGVNNQYLFEVAPKTNKVEIKKAIFKVYGVTPSKINIMNVAGKKIRYGRTEGKTKHWKKAIVTLPQGQKIDIQEGL